VFDDNDFALPPHLSREIVERIAEEHHLVWQRKKEMQVSLFSSH
jgi:hypothetical protein